MQQRFGSVIFDCDSTLSAIEGIEELAADCRAEVSRLTEAAMQGDVPLEEVYGRRLALIQPTREQVQALGRRYIEAVIPDALDVVTALRHEGVDVRVISGGLRIAVCALARALGVPDHEVAGVDVHFDRHGRYVSFDADSPLTRSGGKREVVSSWAGTLPHPVMRVGDGATDLEVAPLVGLFVAFAGVVERPNVVAAADIVVRSLSLAPILPLALGGAPPTSSAARAIYDKGLALLGLSRSAGLSRDDAGVDAARD